MSEIASPSALLLDLGYKEARAFLLKHESYFNGDLPTYFDFSPLLSDIADELGNTPLSDIYSDKKPRECEEVNHIIYANKDGKLSWRPLQLIHPVLYVDLVRKITEKENWDRVKQRFSDFSGDRKIECLSIPAVGSQDRKDLAQQITNWWEGVELRSVECSLEFDYLFETDIADCYGSIYTHSIAWAVETKTEAKKKENQNNTSLLGVFIDKAIQSMQFGQTNGIPQGSVLMDFVAELVLGYVDLKLSEKLQAAAFEDYHILRYRDDYRVFVNSPEIGEQILKTLAEVLVELGMHLNSGKTKKSADVIIASVKEDKLSWLSGREHHPNLYKYAQLIKLHSNKYPNSGSVGVALDKFYRKVLGLKEVDRTFAAVIAIVVDIVCRNPRAAPVAFAIVSKFLSLLEAEDRKDLVRKIENRLSSLPNLGFIEIWFQRAVKQDLSWVEFEERVCQVVKGADVEIWNSEWLGSKALLEKVQSKLIVNQEKLEEAEPIIPPVEFELFVNAYGSLT